MFLSKDVKQQLEQTDRLRTQTQEYQNAYAAVSAGLVGTQVEVDQMSMSATKMDRGLTRVVDYARDTKELQDKSEEMLQQLVEQVDGVRTLGHDVGEAYELQLTYADEQRQALLELQEQSKRYTGLSKTTSEMASKGEESLQQVRRELEDLHSAGGSISNLALQSAIDAGRLGDAGADYIKTAEAIRLLAEEFSNKTAVLQEQMQNVLALHQEQSVQLHKFIQLVKDNNMTLGKIATEAADQLAEPPVDYRKQDKQAEQMLEQIQTLRTEVEQSSKKQSAIMEEMENVGTCYMEQQDSTAKMEEAIADMKRILSDIDYTKEQ